jgi:hypothetical protein
LRPVLHHLTGGHGNNIRSFGDDGHRL